MRQTLKDVMTRDIDDVFLNIDEFAEQIVLDDHVMFAVVERSDMILRDTTDGRGPIAYDNITLYVRKKDIAWGKYYPEKACMLNGEKWFVYSCDGEELVTLILFKERS